MTGRGEMTLQARKKVNQRTRATSISAGGGGSATQAGMDFQNRVAAWVAVRILAEQAASPPWDLPERVTLNFVRCETEQPVDDLLIGASEEGFVFVQVKHTLTLQTREDSAFASTIDQFVRQFVVSHSGVIGRPWERPLDPERDRLVLLIGPSSSAPVRECLPSVLARLRSLAPGQAIDAAAINKREHRAFRVVRDHLARSWQRVLGTQPTDNDLRRLLSLVRVHTLDINDGGAAEREAKACFPHFKN